MKCIKCGALLEDSFRFCDACGTRQKPTLKCSCGRILEEDFKFCPECGKNPNLWATIQYPETNLVLNLNTSMTFYGRVFVKGITDLKYGVSEKSIIKARFGLEDASSSSEFWYDADVNETTNPDFGNNNEYMYTHCFDKTGSFTCTFKFSADEGKTWFFANNSLKVVVTHSAKNFLEELRVKYGKSWSEVLKNFGKPDFNPFEQFSRHFPSILKS